ncbi:MAG: hypothetical protein ACE5PV_27660 [Candidatus Poribacteria bacterium]
MRKTTRDWERRLIQGCYVHHATEPTDCVTCPACGQSMQRQRLRDKWVKTLCGDVLVSRWYFRCPQGHHCFPWDYHQELRGRYSKNVAEAMCRLSARLDFRYIKDELSHHFLEVSHTTLQKTTEAWGGEVNLNSRCSPPDFSQATKADNSQMLALKSYCIRFSQLIR